MDKIEKIMLGILVAEMIGTAGIIKKYDIDHRAKYPGSNNSGVAMYDDNKDGTPDRVQHVIIGGPMLSIRFLYSRKPTTEEIDWYKKN